ncbi:hypothetical protein DXG01_015216, partial [Tephrocybe rancida]
RDGLLINSVRQKLPPALRDLLGSYTSWATFCTGVRGLAVERIKDSQAAEEKIARLTKEVENFQKILQTPSKALASSLRNFTLTSPVPQPRFQAPSPITPAPPVRQTPSITNPGSNNNPVLNRAASSAPVFTDRDPAERWADAERLALPIHPDTPAGRALYDTQVVDWNKRNGTKGPNETRPYPLRPGSQPVATGDCWACGLSGHKNGTCSNSKAPEHETRWRYIASTIKGRMLRNASTAINL